MIKKIMKAVKSGNKKKGKNITVGAVVGFLLSCTAVMGAEEIGLEIGNSGGGIEFSKDGAQFTPQKEDDPNRDPYIDNSWEESTKTYTNNTIISEYNGSGNSYGVKLSGDLAGFNFINNGVTTGSGNNDSCGIYIAGTIETITNNGLIIAKGNGASRVGIYTSGEENIMNTGVVYGLDFPINTLAAFSPILNNYGILAGSNAMFDFIMSGVDLNSAKNYGLIFKVIGNSYKTEVNIQQNYYEKFGKLIEADGYTIVNAKAEGSGKDNISGTESLKLENGKLTYTNSAGSSQIENISSSKKYILNGITDTLLVSSEDNKLNNSAINAYGTAVKFDATGGELILSGTTVNGGADGTSDVISGGNGDDTLTLKNGTIINGTIAGGNGNDTLNFGESGTAKTKAASSSDEIRIMHNISGFENINVNSNVTFYEKTVKDDGTSGDLAITGAGNIIIGANGELILRIDSANGNRHALSTGNTGTIKSENGGKLLLALNGAGNNSIISFGNLALDGSLVTEYEGKYQEDVTFATTSVLHSVKRTSGLNKVEVAAKVNLPTRPTNPDNVTYEKLNKIYHSILFVDKLGNFNVDNDEKLSIFLGYLNDIYAGNPYSYSSELSRTSTGMFREIITENQFKANTGKWMIYGGLTHVDGGTKDTYYGKGYYTYDIGSSDMDADTKITGAYILGEYGVSDTFTSGVVIGGNKLKSDLSNGSKVDGDALYMGAYAKKYIGNLKVTAGAGFQYGDYDADRMAVNDAASSTGTPVMKYSDNYNDMTYDIYLNGRYSHNIGDNLFLEPYGTLSYTYIKQDGADEGSKTLAIETDSKSFDYTVGKIGIDLKKIIPHLTGKSTLSAGVSYTRLLNGADEENITGRFKGGSDFDILVAHKNEHSLGLNAKYALELENGVLFDVKGTYSVERDSHNNSGKNKTKGEWIIGAGLGYKF